MRKTYALNIEGKNRDRLVEAAKHDIRKYVKRERAKTLPVGADYWVFECKSGVNEETAAGVPFADLISAVDNLVNGGISQFYVEVVAIQQQRTPRPINQASQGEQLDDLDE